MDRVSAAKCLDLIKSTETISFYHSLIGKSFRADESSLDLDFDNKKCFAKLNQLNGVYKQRIN